MSKYSELVYMVIDEVKGISDDFYYNEDHILFLLDKYRGFLLKQRYSDIKKVIPESNYQTIQVDLEPYDTSLTPVGVYLKSTKPIPSLMQLGNTKVYPIVDYYQGEITLISKDRMKYIGHNKYLKNFIYCSIAPDKHLYVKSSNPQFMYLEKVFITGIFQDSSKALNPDVGIMDSDFPLEEALVPPLLELVIKDLLNASYRPEDTVNNAHDNLEGLAIKR